MSEQSFDLIVIGAGPGGYTAAIRAAQLGMKTAIVEKDATLCGTCLNVGCIPSKALLESSEIYFEARNGLAAHGVHLAGVELDLAAMMSRKDDVVGQLTKGIAGLMKKNGITRLRGTATIAGPGQVLVAGPDPARLTATSILVATGSRVVELPHLPLDGRRVVSSTEALTLPAVPARMLVVGGGAIGLELGSVWNRLGTDVVVVELMDQIVPGADKQMARTLARILGKQGLDIRTQTSAAAADIGKDSVRVTLESKGPKAGTTTEDFDVVLVAVGRRPNTEGLGCAKAGIELDERGRIRTDARFATSLAGVYAIGDVIAGPMLAHKAEEEGVACVEMLAGRAGHVNYAAIPAVVYTDPELASVGLTEEQARGDGREIKVGSFPFMANGRAKAMGRTEGSVKVIADAATDMVLGIHILGPRASELVAEASLAMEFSASAEDIGRSVHAHPTLAEVLKEAALACGEGSISI